MKRGFTLAQMDNVKTLTFYLNNSMRKRAIAGQTNIINRITNAFESRGYRCLFQENSTVNLLNSVKEPGYSMFHMEHPFHPRALNLRRAYHYPFWQIESSAKRWEWQVALAKFDPNKIDHAKAEKFTNFWRKQLFEDDIETPINTDFIFVPLQGRLLEKRSFQSASPMDMLKSLVLADTERSIRISLHPRETYSEVEMAALLSLIESERRLKLVSTIPSLLLQRCAYVVTQNSSLALNGFFFQKPAILFSKIDFHHIAQNVCDIGVKTAFENVRENNPAFNAFIYWFFQKQSINAGRENAGNKILKTVRQHGWNL